jgi:putative ABC transport system ATP-binding protein
MLIDIRGLEKAYLVGEQPFLALSGVDLTIDSGELVFVVGKSGSGKSTLLNMIAGLDRPSSGEVAVAGIPVHALDEDALARFRGEMIGVVFQFFQLLPTLTAAENVMLAMDFVGKVPASRRRGQALALLEEVGVGDQADKLPTALSGGQQQRVAIARALANDPPLVVADEPTGNLDSQTATSVMELFARLTVAGKTVVLVTHEQESGVKPTRIVSIADGRIAA